VKEKKRRRNDDFNEQRASTEQVKFGDVVQAPPTNLVVPKRVVKKKAEAKQSLYHQQALAQERQRFIDLYRAKKHAQDV
jgi:hypothetical protein